MGNLRPEVAAVREHRNGTAVFEHQVQVLISGPSTRVTPCGGAWKCGNYLIY
jgi:hypothetical protein